MKVFHPFAAPSRVATACAVLACAGLSYGFAAQAQSGQPQTEVLAPPGAAQSLSAPSWGEISRSGTRVYLVDTGEIGRSGEVTSIKLARVPLSAAAGDYSHVVDDYEFKCGARLVRIAASTDYGPDGTTGDAVPDASATWEDIPANSLDNFAAQLACDDRDTTSHFPSVKAFIDAGRH